MPRAILHISILIFAILSTNTVSTLLVAGPIWLVCFFAAIRNKNQNFDIIDLFWLLYSLSYFAAPAQRLAEPDNSFLFDKGGLMRMSFGRYLNYEADQIYLLYLLFFIVALINFLILPKTVPQFRSKELKFNLPFWGFATLLLMSFLFEVFLKGGFSNVMAGRRFKEAGVGGIYTMLVICHTLAICFLFATKIRSYSNAKKIAALFLIFTVLGVLYNPFNSARFFLIQAYLPILLILVPKFRKFSVLAPLLIFGMFVLMPLLSLTTRQGLGADFSEFSLAESSPLGYLDQHVVLLHLLEYVRVNGYAYGSSITGVLLFFVPRAFWVAKPVVLGLVIGGDLYQGGFAGTDNLSGPIVGDLYYDFGVLGVLIGSVAVAYFFRFFVRISARVNNIDVVRFILLASLPILFRGTVGAVLPLVSFTLIYVYLYLFAANNVKWSLK